MVLVHAHRIKTAVGGVLQLVHEVVVHVMRTARVEQRGMNVHPHRRMLVAEPIRQLGIGHQVKPHQAHRTILFLPSSPGLSRPSVLAVRRRYWPALDRGFKPLRTPATPPAMRCPSASATSGARARRTYPAASASPVPRTAAYYTSSVPCSCCRTAAAASGC